MAYHSQTEHRKMNEEQMSDNELEKYKLQQLSLFTNAPKIHTGITMSFT